MQQYGKSVGYFPETCFYALDQLNFELAPSQISVYLSIMMRRVLGYGLSLLFLLAGLQGAHAQGFKKKDNVISASYGFGSLYQAIAFAFTKSALNDEFGSAIKVDTLATTSHLSGPIFFKYEHGFKNWLGLGVVYAHMNSTSIFGYSHDSVHNNATTQYSSFSLMLRLNFHLAPRSRNLDPYIGFGVGLRNYHVIVTSPERNMNKFLNTPFPGLEATFGLRGYVTPKFGFFAELGFAKAVLQLGVCAKI
jgi:hypothetical protein